MKSIVRGSFSADPSSGLRRSAAISNVLFVAGLALTAVTMAWDRVPSPEARPPFFSLNDSRGLAPHEVLTFLLLFQRGLVMAWDRYRKREGAWPKASLLAAFALPAIAAGVATMTAFNVGVAVLASLIFCFVLVRGWLLAQYIREHELKLFENITLWVAVAAVVLGYYQFFSDVFGLPQSWTQLMPSYSSDGTYPFPRIQSFALEPLYLAHWMFLPLGILLTRYWRTRSAPVFEQILLVFTLGLFLLTLSRGAMMGLALALLVLIVVGRAWRPLLYLGRNAAIAAVIVAAMLSLAGAVKNAEAADPPGAAGPAAPADPSDPSAPSAPATPAAKANPVEAFTEHAVDLNDGSAQTRYELWPRTLDIFLDNPLTGVGPNNSRLLLHGGSASASTSEANALQPVNNDYLAYLSELGLVGVILILPLAWLVLQALWGTVRARLDHPSSPYAFALVGMAFQANAFHSLVLLRTWVVIGLLVAGAKLVREKQVRANDSREASPSSATLAGSVGSAPA